MGRFRLFFYIFIIFSFGLYAHGSSEKVSLQLDWLHQFQFAGYYMAKEKGFYKQRNLKVNIKEFTKNTKLTEEVLNSTVNYAIGKSSVVIDKMEGKDLVLLSAIYQTSPMVLISLAKSNIRKIEDLKNKRVSLTNDARMMASINSMIKSQDLDTKDIIYKEHSFNIEDLINAKTDAMACYISNETYTLEKRGIDYNVHNPSDYGFDFYGGILFTSKKELEDHPSRVKDFTQASLKGWKYAFDNIEETAKIIFNKYNTQNKTLDSLVYEGRILRTLSGYENGLLGNIDIKKIEELRKIYLLLSLGNISAKSNLDDFLYDSKKIYLSKEEKKYLENNNITLVVNEIAPFVFKNDEKYMGMAIDYWNLIKEKIGYIKSKIKRIRNKEKAIEFVKKNENSLKFYFQSYENEDILKKSSLIYDIPIALSTLKDKSFVSDILDLKNKKIVIYESSDWVLKFKNKYKNLEFISVSSIKEAFSLLRDGEVFGIAGKLPVLLYLVNEGLYPNIKISGIFEDKYKLKFGLNQDNDILLNIINKAILSLDEQEKKKIFTKYYSTIHYQSSLEYGWIYKIFLPLFLIIIAALIIIVRLKQEIQKKQEVENHLSEIANLDTLTQIYNRGKIEKIFEIEILRTKRYNRDLSIIFIDIDDFKRINDTLGHKAGDKVLIKLVKCIKKHIRASDYLGRWGGEEFIVILPETTSAQAKELAYLIKTRINEYNFDTNKQISASFGVTQFKKDDSFNSFIERADNAMYYVKRNGKNGVKAV